MGYHYFGQWKEDKSVRHFRWFKQNWKNRQMIKCNFEKYTYLQWRGKYKLLINTWLMEHFKNGLQLGNQIFKWLNSLSRIFTNEWQKSRAEILKTFSCHKKLYCIKLLEMNKEEKETWIAVGRVFYEQNTVLGHDTNFCPLLWFYSPFCHFQSNLKGASGWRETPVTPIKRGNQVEERYRINSSGKNTSELIQIKYYD